METGKLPDQEKQALVEKLSKDPAFSHGVFGCFRERINGGHFFQESRGESKLPSKIFDDEEVYVYAFDWRSRRVYNEPPRRWFNGRVVEKQTEEKDVIFILSFPDWKGDGRPGSHTDYLLVIPANEALQLAPLIENDPSIMIDIFKKVYPYYDRSEGKLVIDPNVPSVIQMDLNK